MRLALLALLAASVATAQTSATYEVTFTSTWSAATHPDGFPSNPHYSSLIGAAHAADVVLWETGQTATDGIELMAETGATSALRAEVEAHAQAGRIARVLSGSSLAVSPGTATMTVEVDIDAPLVSLVTMLAPSPDWFVGVSGLDLRDGDGWVTEQTVDLFLYDAGTDDGETYTAPNADTDPRQPIARVETAPFLVDGSPAPIGTFTFQRTSVSTPSAPEQQAALSVYPNPVTSGATTLRLGGGVGDVEVRILDVRGREVFAASVRVPAAGDDLPVRTDAWAPGVYVVRVVHAQGAEAGRLTVVR